MTLDEEIRKLGKTNSDRQLRKKLGLSKKELASIKTKNRKIRTNKIKKYLTIGATVGASIFLGSTYFNKDNNELDTYNNYSQVSDTFNKTSVDNYIHLIADFSKSLKDTTKQKIYFILQKHAAPSAFTDDYSFIKNSVEHTLENQLSVYRILEHLHKNENLQLICGEGVKYDDNIGVTSPNWYKDDIGTEKFNRMNQQTGDDKYIKELIRRTNGYFGADNIVSMLNTNLYLVGFEKDETYGAPPEVKLNIIDSETTPFKEDKIEAIYDDLIKGNKSVMKWLEEVDSLAPIRSNNALKYAMKHSEDLYEDKIISNKDVAIVIGEAHIKDYQHIIDTIERGDEDSLKFNPIFIWPKGIKEEEIKWQSY